MTIKDLDSFFVLKNGVSKFLPMITENSCLKIEYTVNNLANRYKSFYINCIDGDYTFETVILPNGYFNTEIANVSFMITAEKLNHINDILGIQGVDGDVVTLKVFFVFNKEAISLFSVQFPNNFPKEYSEVVCSDEKYSLLIESIIAKYYKKSNNTENKKVINRTVDVVYYNIRIPIDVKIITYTQSLPSILTIKLVGNDFRLYAYGKDKGKISEYVDDFIVATLKAYGKTYIPSIKNKTVCRRMKKYYGE